MSDARDERGRPAAPRAPIAPRAAPPIPPKATSPKPPAVSPPRVPQPSNPDLPPAAAWDDADTQVDKQPEKTALPAVEAKKDIGSDRALLDPQRVTPVNPIAPASPTPNPAAQGSASRALEAALPGLTPAQREQVWAIVRAAVDESLAPLQQKLKEVEAKLSAVGVSGAAAKQVLASIPVPLASLTPTAPLAMPKVSAPPPADAKVPRAAAVPVSLAPSGTTPSGVPAQPRPSYTSTSFGLVSHPPGPPPKSIMEEAAEIGPIEIPDFGKKRRLVGRVVIVLMLMIVTGAIVATILSHQG